LIYCVPVLHHQNNKFVMMRFLCSLSFVLLAYFAQAQVAQSAIYILFSSQNMDVLDYRPAYSNNITKYYAYNFRTKGNDQYMLYAGSGLNMDYLPTNSVSSASYTMSDEVVSSVNKVTRQFFVVLQQQRGYIVAPITKITKVTQSGKFTFINALDYSFVFDTDNISMGRELSTAGSGSSVALNSFGYQNCKYQYAFKRTPNVQNGEIAEFNYIPGIGITMERSGRTTTEMQANEVNLWSINGLTLSDYIAKECGGTANVNAQTPPGPAPLPGNVVPPTDPQLGNPQTGYAPPATAPAPGNAAISAISKYPIANCGKVADAGMHIVQPKETVNRIASFYGVTAANVLKWNNIKDANKISVCQELKIAAPGGKVPKGLNPIIMGAPAGVSTGVTVTPPPAAPGSVPTYTPTPTPQPSPSPGFITGQGGGAYYPSPQPLPNPTVQPPPANPNAGGGQYYAVQKGEGVSAIARKFGFTEERFRAMNGLPATGNVPLQLGQRLRVSDCDVYSTPNTGLQSDPSGVIPQLTLPVGGGATGLPTGALPQLLPQTSDSSKPPGTTSPGFTPVGNVPIGTQPAVTTPIEPAKGTNATPSVFAIIL
jgi:LysM repeat protein